MAANDPVAQVKSAFLRQQWTRVDELCEVVVGDDYWIDATDLWSPAVHATLRVQQELGILGCSVFASQEVYHCRTTVDVYTLFTRVTRLLSIYGKFLIIFKDKESEEL